MRHGHADLTEAADLLHEGRFEEAGAALRRARACLLDPAELSELWALWAQVYMGSGKHAEALTAVQRAADAAGWCARSGDLSLWRGRCLMRLHGARDVGMCSEARATFEEAMVNGAGYPALLAMAELAMGQVHFDEAEACIAAAVADGAPFEEVWERRVECLTRLKRDAEACEVYDGAVARGVRLGPGAQLRRLLCMALSGRAEEALAALADADGADDAESDERWDVRWTALMALGRWSELRDSLEAARAAGVRFTRQHVDRLCDRVRSQSQAGCEQGLDADSARAALAVLDHAEAARPDTRRIL